MAEREAVMSRFKAKITLPNGEIVNCTGKTISDAFANLLAKCTNGLVSQQAVSQSLKEYGDNWFKTYHVPKVKPNTAMQTKLHLEKHIYPYIGNKPLNQITHDDVQMLFNNMNSYAQSSVKKVRITLNQIMKNAVEDGIISTNVMNSDRYVISKKVTKRNALSKQQALSIIAQLDNLEEDERLFLSLALFTGMRRGEILALEWDNVDLEQRIIHVQQAVTFNKNRPIIGNPKSTAGFRYIAINIQLFSVLSSVSEQKGFVIRNHSDKSIPLTETAFKRLWERINKKINLYGATPHVLRHTFASLMEPYTDVKTLQSVMGHADISTTLNRYAHPNLDNIAALGKADVFAT